MFWRFTIIQNQPWLFCSTPSHRLVDPLVWGMATQLPAKNTQVRAKSVQLSCTQSTEEEESEQPGVPRSQEIVGLNGWRFPEIW